MSDDALLDRDAPQLHLRLGSSNGGGPLLVFIHGLGGTGELWRPLIGALSRRGWTDGAWVAVDLPGHGRSRARARYSFGGLAGDVADTLAASGVSAQREIVIVGHSLGAAVGLALASGWFGFHVGTCVGLGLKVTFTAEETDRAHRIAKSPTKVFSSREQAAEFWLKLAGLTDIAASDDALLTDALVETPTGWRVAFDNGVTGVAGADIPGLLSASRAQVHLAHGENDPMVSATDIRKLGLEPITITDAGHNAHVERPDALSELLIELGV